MMNIYNGNIKTDANGFATVEMPDYFDALNKEFRYQLTCIGTFAQAIIKEEMSGNQFVIQTNQPNVKVSWQVTGIRHDKYADAHRIVPEVAKEAANKVSTFIQKNGDRQRRKKLIMSSIIQSSLYWKKLKPKQENSLTLIYSPLNY